MNGEPKLTAQQAEAIKAKAHEHQERMSVVAEANATPMPGALADAFKIAPEIVVGNYRVRPFYDIDFEFLQQLNHPLHEIIVASQAGKPFEKELLPVGQPARELCFIFTREPEVTEELITKGNGDFAHAAKKEFGRMQFQGMNAILTAIQKQMVAYWGPVIGYGEEETEGASGTRNFSPDTKASPRTDLGGS